jgi:hypothetical protein
MTETISDLRREVACLREERAQFVKRLIAKDVLLEKLQKRRAVHAVFAYPLMYPGHRELLGLYSTRERAEDFSKVQDKAVRNNLAIVEIEIDRHPNDDFWVKP